MTSEDIIAVVDALCEKLGLAVNSVNELVPELARMKIATSAVGTIVSLLITAAGVGIVVWAFRKGMAAVREDNAHRKPYVAEYTLTDEEGYFAMIFVGGLIALIAAITAFCNTVTMVSWIAAPNVKAIEYLVSLVG